MMYIHEEGCCCDKFYIDYHNNLINTFYPNFYPNKSCKVHGNKNFVIVHDKLASKIYGAINSCTGVIDTAMWCDEFRPTACSCDLCYPLRQADKSKLPKTICPICKAESWPDFYSIGVGRFKAKKMKHNWLKHLINWFIRV